jgi:hypothetical protein
MYVDYTNLNKACKKDSFSLPWIDQVVDSTTYCILLNFLDCYSGYHQILLMVDDQIKMSFITLFGAFYYTTMPFGLKSVDATYQRVYNSVCTHNLGAIQNCMLTTVRI